MHQKVILKKNYFHSFADAKHFLSKKEQILWLLEAADAIRNFEDRCLREADVTNQLEKCGIQMPI
jgi:hypothetical protein